MKWFPAVLVLLVITAGSLESSDDGDSDYDVLDDHQDDYETPDEDDDDEMISVSEGHRSAVPWSSLCPPPMKPLSQSACGAKPCNGNSDCLPRHNHTYLCCHNGCVETCMRALDPPPEFDWIEEDPPDIKNKIVVGQVAPHLSPPESVALPGGCVITPAQFLSLEGFKQNKHVSDCFCDVGGVFCKIVQ